MTQHTPGPWNIGANHEGFCTVTDGRFTICTFCTVGAADLFPEILANARLIACAPNLLDKLKCARIYLSPSVSEPLTQLINEIDSLIAQAEGGTKS